MNSNWAKAARSTTKYQLVLMLTLVGSSVTPSPAQAGLDEKSEVLAEWLVDVTICSQSDLTTAPQRATAPISVPEDALAVAPAEPAWTPITKAVPGVLIRGTLKGDHQGRFLLHSLRSGTVNSWWLEPRGRVANSTVTSSSATMFCKKVTPTPPKTKER